MHEYPMLRHDCTSPAAVAALRLMAPPLALPIWLLLILIVVTTAPELLMPVKGVPVEVEVFPSPLQHPFALSTRAAGVSKGYPNPPHAVAVAVASAFDVGPRVWSHVAGAEIG